MKYMSCKVLHRTTKYYWLPKFVIRFYYYAEADLVTQKGTMLHLPIVPENLPLFITQ